MTKARTVALLLAAVALCAASPLAQAATTTVLHTARYEIARDNDVDAWGVPGVPGPPENFNNWNRNVGAGTQLRIKTFEYVYHGDWDAPAMQVDIEAGGALMVGPLLGQPGGGTNGWGSYSPIYSLSITPTPSAAGNWPVDPVAIHISCVWSENDWTEGAGVETNWENYNWPIDQYAATYMCAEDTMIGGMELPWAFPGGGVGANAPYPVDPDCTFLGTFLTNGDVRDVHPLVTANMESKTPTNSIDIIGCDADAGNYITADLDQAIIDDMLQNSDNVGLALWNLDDGGNKNIYSDNQHPLLWPYIQARIEVCDGDANLDKAVDGLDYVIWSNNYQLNPLANTWLEGDYTGEGDVDGLDYVVWSNNYQTCPAVPGVVPEPATMVLLAMGAVALIRRRR